MKFGNRNTEKGFLGKLLSKPVFNRNKIYFTIAVISIIFAAIFLLNMFLWLRLQKKVSIAMTSREIYKNELLTPDMFYKYDMVEAEYQRYAISDKNSVLINRLVLWEDVPKLKGYFSAYTIRKDNPIEYKNLISSISDNSNLVRYSHPGKELIKLDVSSSELNKYKDMLSPGDKINIMATYEDKVMMMISDRVANNGNRGYEVDTIKTDTVFTGLEIADIRNPQNKSVLDYLSKYRELSAFEQAAIAKTEEYQKATDADTIFVSLTPSEIEKLKLYESMQGVKFSMSIPDEGIY